MNPQENPLVYFFFITKSIERVLGKNVRDACGVSHADAKLLTMISSCPSVKQTILAEMLEVSAPAVSRQIERLVKRGYVTRTVNPNNRRALDINLTPEGKKVAKKTKKYLLETLAGILKDIGGVTDNTSKELGMISNKLKQSLSEDQNEFHKALQEN